MKERKTIRVYQLLRYFQSGGGGGGIKFSFVGGEAPSRGLNSYLLYYLSDRKGKPLTWLQNVLQILFNHLYIHQNKYAIPKKLQRINFKTKRLLRTCSSLHLCERYFERSFSINGMTFFATLFCT